MLATAQRLRHRDDFTAAVRSGRRAGRGVLVVHLALGPAGLTSPPGPALDQVDQGGSPAGPVPARAGFVVPRAVGAAVVRNRVRRRLRHLVRERLGVLPEGAVLVVRALPGAGITPYRQLALDLDGAIDAARRPRTRGDRR